jgi:glycine cleavage system aminomethyltransferase T
MIVEGAPARRTHVFLSIHLMSPIFMLVSNRTRQDFAPTNKLWLGSPKLKTFLSKGAVTSGIPSPTLQKNIAMEYVKNGWHKKGTEVEVEARNRRQEATLTLMPFMKPNYWRG